MNFLISRIENFFNKGHERTRKAKKQIFASLLFRGVSIVASFVLTPLTLRYLGGGDSDLGLAKFGIWLTLSSLIGWFGFFDIGVGNGLRNKFAEALAKNDKESAKSYVSTAYAIFIGIFGAFLLIFLAVNPLLNWVKILNIPEPLAGELAGEVETLAIFVVFFFCLRFVINLISTLLVADQRPALSNAINPVGNVISLLLLLILFKTYQGSLLFLGMAFTIAPILIIIAYSIYFFRKDYKDYIPRRRYVNLKHTKALGGVGIQFFIIQIAVVIIFQTDKMIITQVLDARSVPEYEVAFKYFNMVTMIFTIIVMPFWSAYTEAFTKGDFGWIKRTNRGLVQVWIIMAVGVVFMIFISDWFYRMWLGKEYFEIPFFLSVFMGLFVLISTWNNIYANFLNGTGKIRLQLYVSVVIAALNIPVSVYFAKNLGMGTAGVILGTCVSLFPGVIINPIQYRKIVTKTDKGIWGK